MTNAYVDAYLIVEKFADGDNLKLLVGNAHSVEFVGALQADAAQNARYFRFGQLKF
jgi:hypothetical protein